MLHVHVILGYAKRHTSGHALTQRYSATKSTRSSHNKQKRIHVRCSNSSRMLGRTCCLMRRRPSQSTLGEVETHSSINTSAACVIPFTGSLQASQQHALNNLASYVAGISSLSSNTNLNHDDTKRHTYTSIYLHKYLVNQKFRANRISHLLMLFDIDQHSVLTPHLVQITYPLIFFATVDRSCMLHFSTLLATRYHTILIPPCTSHDLIQRRR